MDDLESVTPVPAGDALVKVQLVPVEVFGADRCDECEAPAGYGLMDAVEAWSDCNRAIGRIYRVDDMSIRQPGDVITVYVPQPELAKFRKRYGSGAEDCCPACHVPYAELPEGHRLNRPSCTVIAVNPAAAAAG